ncbi:MAG: 30S ribosomal protein S20 [bacterium]|nr:30S ribosomal protein S20 [bacterium]MBU1918369.1 30S ribosomal protein S20 [bacterium]
MATHKSALKRHRQSLKHRQSNRAMKAEIQTLTKKVINASEEEAPVVLKALQSKIDKAGRKGVLHYKNAAHRVSQMMRKVTEKTIAKETN